MEAGGKKTVNRSEGLAPLPARIPPTGRPQVMFLQVMARGQVPQHLIPPLNLL